MEQNDDKLKEIEKALAQELDQKVKLTDTNDLRIGGSIQVNPTLDTSKPATQIPDLNTGDSSAPAAVVPAPATPAPDAASATGQSQAQPQMQNEELSLDAIDGLLNDIDGDFKGRLGDISSELKQVEGQIVLKESIAISQDYLPQEKKEEPKPETKPEVKSTDGKKDGAVPAAPAKPVLQAPEISILEGLLQLIKATLVIVPSILRSLPHEIARLKQVGIRKELKDITMIFKVPIAVWKVALHEFIRSIKEAFKYFIAAPIIYKIKVVAIFTLIISAAFLFRNIIEQYKFSREKYVGINNLVDMADSIHPISEEEGEDLDSPMKHPEYVVLLETIVSTLKAPSIKKNPMARVELYIEASNQMAATEIKDREIEIRDMISRILEQLTFEELETTAGKLRLKVLVRREANKILNKGRVRRIFFKTFVIHPGL